MSPGAKSPCRLSWNPQVGIFSWATPPVVSSPLLDACKQAGEEP